MKSVVVFCSSSSDVSPAFFSEIETLGRELAHHQIQIVYGGAKVGLMGRLADVALAHGGKVVGVIPRYLARPEIVHSGLTKLVVVDDLLDRKKKMLSMADGAVAAPGGIGTIDEITEVIALKQLGEHSKPIFFHNFLDFWQPLFDYFVELQARRMIHQDLSDLYMVYDEAQKLASRLKDS